MSEKLRKLFTKIISLAGIFFFVLAAFMLYWQLRNYSLSDIAHALLSIPKFNLLAACIACFFGYLTLSLYDFLSLRYINEKIVWWKWMLAGILGFAISNNAGHALVSGGAIRYRLYSRWHISGGDIIKMVIFSGLTYFLGCSAILIVGYFIIPAELLNQSVGASVGITTLFIICLSTLLIYFGITIIFRNKSVTVGKIKFQVPKIKMALFQMGLGIMDNAFAALVLYFCIVPFVQIPFWTFIALFVVAQTIGVFSQVPGGIGVFETIFLLVVPQGLDKAHIFGGLLAYRVIYYVFPLIGAGSLFFIYENYFRTHMKRWLTDAKQKIPNFSIKKTNSKNKK